MAAADQGLSCADHQPWLASRAQTAVRLSWSDLGYDP